MKTARPHREELGSALDHGGTKNACHGDTHDEHWDWKGRTENDAWTGADYESGGKGQSPQDLMDVRKARYNASVSGGGGASSSSA